MRRRSRQARSVASRGVGGEYDSDARSSLGDGYVETACNTINRQMARTANMMVEYSPSCEDVLPMLFLDDTLAKLKAVLGMVDPSTSYKYYRITPHVSLRIYFDGAAVPTIEPEHVHVQPFRAEPLLKAIEEIRAIYIQYERVKHTLRWFNRNATPGAIRHYWPAVLQLCPDSPALKDLKATPARFASPPKIGQMLPLIRETASTMSMATLLPADAAPRKHDKLQLTFYGEKVSDGTYEFETDEMNINL